MNNIKPKLIIWDFDGVLSDSEELWIKIWQELSNERFNLNWSFETANKTFGGISVKTKIANMAKLGLVIDDDFMEEIMRREKFEIANNFFATDGVEEILKSIKNPYCIATGGILKKTEAKLQALDFKKYFPNDYIFTAEQVEHGKPAPDLFLFAAKKMNYDPSDCIVIEDSIAGLTAAINAKMLPVAFTGSKMNNNPEYVKKVRYLGIEHIFDNMKDLQQFL